MLGPVIHALPEANGIIGTKDGKTLFISDTETVQVYAYDINADGTLSNARLFAKRFSDGMALDEHGNLYLSAEEGIAIFNPQGEEIEFIPTPERPANSAFGGGDGKTLYITARKRLYSFRMNVVNNLFKYMVSSRLVLSIVVMSAGDYGAGCHRPKSSIYPSDRASYESRILIVSLGSDAVVVTSLCLSPVA